MKAVDNPTNTWKTKEGVVAMDQMSDEHLQNALNHAEHRFIQYHNEVLNLSEKVALFEVKMLQLKKEAQRRGIQLRSLCDGKRKKYSILENTYRFAEKIDRG